MDYVGVLFLSKFDVFVWENGGFLLLIIDDVDVNMDVYLWKVVKIIFGEDGDIFWVFCGSFENVVKVKELI